MSVNSERPDLPEPDGSVGESTEAAAAATAGTAAATAATTAPPTAASARQPQGFGALLTRLHFYAGVMVAPFLLVAAVIGLLYAFTPQLDSLVYGKELTVARTGGSALSLSDQVARASAEHPEGTLTAVRPGSGESTTQVDFALPELGETAHTVYVDLYTGEVTGQLTTWWTATPPALLGRRGALRRAVRGQPCRAFLGPFAPWSTRTTGKAGHKAGDQRRSRVDEESAHCRRAQARLSAGSFEAIRQ
ncbi:PepSY domain-containing protein [Streptomyces tuirus]|uniref:PepSY domain-containing protein n=1 Tax=Streptomyces tuirus TaxID=68278 RepID=A0A941FA86_9ACTN|nr:PepSY domain-containing protein [Streptomyces tuirus]